MSAIPTTVKFPPATLDKLKEASQKTGLPIQEIIRLCAGIGLIHLKKIDYDIQGTIYNAPVDGTEGNVLPLRPKANILAAAGSPITAEVLDWDHGDVVQVKISGLSMVPLLNDGDVIEMRHKKSSRNPFMKKGLIYLVAYDGGYTVKRYNTRKATEEEKEEEWVEDGKVKVLESVNPDYPEIIIKQPLEWVAWYEQKKKV